jgi:hypothetical protein
MYVDNHLSSLLRSTYTSRLSFRNIMPDLM